MKNRQPTLVLGLALVTCVTSELTAQDGMPKLREFRAAFAKQSRPKQAHINRRSEMLNKASVRSAAWASEFLLAFQNVDRECNALDKGRWKRLQKDGSTPDSKGRIRILAKLRSLQSKIISNLEACNDDDARDLLLRRALLNSKLPFTLRIKLAATARKVPTRQTILAKAAQEAGADAPNSICCLTAIGACGVDGGLFADWVVGRLEHQDPSVREAAADTAVAVRAAKAIRPLIERLNGEEGHTRLRLASALERLTGQRLGTSQTAWLAWFTKEGKALVAAGSTLPKPKRAKKGKRKAGKAGKGSGNTVVKYHGIRLDGKDIIFVLDAFGSMKQSISPKTGTKASNRFELAAGELMKAVKKLGPKRTFNIVTFGRSTRRFSKTMVKANAENADKARRWLTDLRLSRSGTNLYRGFELAFNIAGRGATDRYYGLAADTFCLLSDGDPWVNGVRDKWPRIHEALGRWNSLGRIVIHVVGLGKGAPVQQLRRIAKRHGGTFKLFKD